MDIGKSFTYMFEDKEWPQKTIIGAVVNIVPVLNLVAWGYGLRTLKRVSESTEPSMPDWDDWGGDFGKGLMSFLAILIYSVPLLGLQIVSWIVQFVAGNDGGAVICTSAVACLGFLWSILELIVLLPAFMMYTEKWDFGSFFRFGDIYRFIADHLSDYIVVLLLAVAAQIVAWVVGGIACVIGLVYTLFWAILVAAHLLGQLKLETMPAATASSLDLDDIQLEDLDEEPEASSEEASQ